MKPIRGLPRCFPKFLTSLMKRSARRCRSLIIRRRRRPIPRISTTTDFYRSWKVADSSKNSMPQNKEEVRPDERLRVLLLAQPRQCRLDTRSHTFESAREFTKIGAV